jgi:hypothetical protein
MVGLSSETLVQLAYNGFKRWPCKTSCRLQQHSGRKAFVDKESWKHSSIDAEFLLGGGYILVRIFYKAKARTALAQYDTGGRRRVYQAAPSTH